VREGKLEGEREGERACVGERDSVRVCPNREGVSEEKSVCV